MYCDTDWFTAHTDGSYSVYGWSTPQLHMVIPNARGGTTTHFMTHISYPRNIAAALDHSARIHAENNPSSSEPQDLDTSKFDIRTRNFLDSFLYITDPRPEGHIYKNILRLRDEIRSAPVVDLVNEKPITGSLRW